MRRTATTFVLALLALAALPATAFAVAAPTIEFATPDPIRNHEASLRFSIDPEGLETSYEVMYGEEAGVYHPFHEPLDGMLPEGDEPVALAKKIPVFFEAQLKAGTEYHWRVVARNAEGETKGTDQVFTTTNGPKPVFSNGEATQTGSTSVRFSGIVDPEGAPLTGCRFRYVDKATFTMAGFEKHDSTGIVRFGETVPCEESLGEIGSGTEAVTVQGEATGLEPGEYVFRVEGENAYEDSVPVGGVFFTMTAPPPVTVPGDPPPFPELTPPGISIAPGLQKPHRKKRARRGAVRHNATIVAPAVDHSNRR